MNPMQLLQLIRNGQNPQQIAMNLLQTQAGDTPMGKNLLALAQNNQTPEIEKIIRNLAQQRGIDFDKEFTAFRQMTGL